MNQQQLNFIIDSLKNKSIDTDFYKILINIIESIIHKENLFGLWHPLGFIIITLQDWYRDERLRIHIWPASLRKYNNNKNWIHNHEYNITSLVLIGKIINNKYNFYFSEEEQQYPLYNVLHNGTNSDLVNTHKFCNIKFSTCEEIFSGQIYSIDKTEFHSSDTSLEEITCTLVLNKNKQTSSPNIVGEADYNQEKFIYKREFCDQNYLKSLLKKILVELKKN